MEQSHGERVDLLAMSQSDPEKLARFLMQPKPQPVEGSLQTSGQMERIAFDSGGVRCRGWWVRPKTTADRSVILAHGWTSHLLKMQLFLEPLLQEGYQVLLYNARGHGDSDFWPTCSLAQFTEDLDAAIHFARSRVSHVATIGHSLGAAASILTASDGAPVEAVAAVASPGDSVQVIQELMDLQGIPSADLILKRLEPHVCRIMGRDMDSIAPARRIAEVRCPVLLVHGRVDQVVSVSHFHGIRRQAGSNVESLLLEGEDHHTIKSAALPQVISFLKRTFPPSV